MPLTNFRSISGKLALALLLSLGLVSDSGAQSACGPRGTAVNEMPRYTGTLPNVLSTGGSSAYLYVLTQWGFARSNLSDPANPGGFSLVNIGREAGSGNGGVIAVNCDCHQGATMMGVAEAPDGSSRMISDFLPGSRGFGLPGLVARADGGGAVKYGAEVNLSSVFSNRKVGAIYAPSSQKYFAYFPTRTSGVQVVDVTNTNNSIDPNQALVPYPGVAWSEAGALSAEHVQTGSYNELLLLGATPDATASTIRVARINPASGAASEIAAVSASGYPLTLTFGVVNGRIFIFSAEGTQGLRMYEFTPSQFGGTITPAGSIPGNFSLVVVRGGQFPVIFAHRQVSGVESYVDVYDTKFLVQGGAYQLAASLRHVGASMPFRPGVEAVVKSAAGVLTAYVYREANPATSGAEPRIVTDVVDLTCISADLTAPPFANASLTNASAALRSGAEATKNYFGDRWRVQNSSASAVALDQIEWDLNVLNVGGTQTFTADAGFSGSLPNAALSDLNPIYFPCDPSGAVLGNPRTGANCYNSVRSPAGPADFRIGVRSHNANGWSTAPFISSAVTIQAPIARIVGLSGGILRVLSGGQADASGSDGNVAEAAFNWAFFDSVGGDVGTALGSRVSIPLASKTFRLTPVYAGGYTAPVLTGSIQQVDLVPDFTATPGTVVKNGTLTLNNTMQISPNATLTSVTYAINSTPALSGTLGSGFTGSARVDTVMVPGVPGSYTIQLTYNFTSASAGAQSLSVTKPFTVIDQIILTLVANPTTANAGQSIAFTSAGGTSTSTYGWTFGDTFPPNLVAGGATNSHVYTRAGTFTAVACVTNAGSPQPCANTSVTINGNAPPPPPPPPPPTGNLSVSLSCPSQGPAGAAVSCSASASGGSSYAYGWNWGEGGGAAGGIGGGGSGGGFASGPATNSHTYASPGTFTVTVQVTSGSQSKTATASIGIVPSGPPRPSAAYNLTGATPNQFGGNWDAEAGRTIGFTATEPDAAATFSWEVIGGPTLTGRSVQYAFGSPGSKTVTLTVTGGGTATAGVTSTQIKFNVSPSRFQALMIPGAGHIDPVPPATDGTWATDVSITNPGTQPTTLTLYFEPFGTPFPDDLSQIPFNSLNSVPLAAGQSWSATDVVKSSLAKDGRGILMVKYEGGNADPIATATVYYTQQGKAFGSSLPTFKVGPNGATTTQSLQTVTEQTLVGLRNDGSYRFNVSLFNASGSSGFFQLSAFGDDGSPVSLLDETGASVATRQFPIGPFQQVLLQSGDLGLTDPAKRYVLKASPVSSTTGGLIAAASALDRRNNDLVQVSDDTPRITAANDALVDYFIPGVGRILTDGAHWKTDLTLYSSSTLPRDLTFEYRFTDANRVEQRVLAPVTVPAGKSVILDDVVSSVLARYAPAGLDLNQISTLGLLRISYRSAGDSTTAPLLIGGRIYDDRGAEGTAGMQLFVYSNGESVTMGSPLVLPGAQQNLRFRTNIGFFAMGELLTRVRLTAVKPDGSEGGRFEFLLNEPSQSGHYVQVPMAVIPGIVGEPMTIKVEVLEGSRVGAYVVTVDQISSDSIFVQGRPTRLAN